MCFGYDDTSVGNSIPHTPDIPNPTGPLAQSPEVLNPKGPLPPSPDVLNLKGPLPTSPDVLNPKDAGAFQETFCTDLMTLVAFLMTCRSTLQVPLELDTRLISENSACWERRVRCRFAFGNLALHWSVEEPWLSFLAFFVFNSVCHYLPCHCCYNDVIACIENRWYIHFLTIWMSPGMIYFLIFDFQKYMGRR